MPSTELFCTNCGASQVPETSQPPCHKCGGRKFESRLTDWARPLSAMDKRLLRSFRIHVEDDGPRKEKV